MKAKRNKSNLVATQPKPPEKRLLTAQERRHYLNIIGLWRVFDLYFYGLQELA